MIIKKILLTLFATMGIFTISAQGSQTEKTEYVFNPHWYLQLQPVGAQYTLGETSFKDLVSYNVQIGGGYQFSSVAGVRLSANAWQSKGGWSMHDMDLNWKWNYVAPMIDVTASLTNLFCGYNPNRIFDFSVFGGVGANIAWNNKQAADVKETLTKYYAASNPNKNLEYLWSGTKTRFVGRMGVMADFRISSVVKVGMELQANVLNDHYNSKSAGNADWYFNGLIGVKIALGKTHSTRTITPPAPTERIVERVVERVVEKPVAAPAPTKAVEEVQPLKRDIFFTLSSSRIEGKAENAKVAEIANYLKANPNATVTVTGYADKGTGNAQVNMKISQKRTQTVVNALINEYGISSSRIIAESKGDTVQPFAIDVKNRVAICIAK